MAAPRPWTQSIEIAWRPELRFYEERFSLLRAFDDSGDLRAFRVGESHFDARLFDPVQELSVRQNGLRLHTFHPDADTDRSWDAIRRAVGRLGINRFSGVSTNYQHLLELPVELETAVAAAYETLFTPLGTTDVVFDDWALTVNVDVEGPPGSSGLIEFGIVESDEVPARLERSVGALTYYARGVSGQWTASEFKDVSLFVDTHLDLDATEPDSGETALDRVHAFWEGSRQQISDLTLELAHRLIGSEMDNEGGMAG